MIGAAWPILVPIDNPVNDAVRLDEEVDMLSWVDIPQEVLVNCHQQLHVPMEVYGGPDWTQFTVHVLQIVQVLQQLLDDEVGKWLALLLIHIGGKLSFNPIWQIQDRHGPLLAQGFRLFVL